MFELDNLDLDLDDDFPTGPMNKIFSPENGVSETFHSGLKKKEETNSERGDTVRNNSTESILKILSQNDFKQKPSDIFKRTEPGEKRVVNSIESNLFKYSPRFSDIQNNVVNEKSTLDHENSRLNDSTDLNSTKRILTHRKFPGPAGLLPDKPLKELTDINLIVDNSFDNVCKEGQKDSVILCSQTSTVFSEASFKKLTLDFGMNEYDCPLNKYTIDWVKKSALKKTLFGKKIPFLAAVLHQSDHSTPDPVLTLKDQTGEMYGTLHREVWSDLGEKLHPGAALALRQVGVLITGITRRQVYLNITINNIINIYSYSNEEEEIETNIINNFKKSDLLKSVSEWQCATVANLNQNITPKPFSTIGGTKIINPKCSATKPESSIRNSISQSYNKNKSNQQNNDPYMNFPSSDATSDGKVSSFMNMEDDVSDFLLSLDEDSINRNSRKTGIEGPGLNIMDCDNNTRKRKINDEDVSTSKAVCKRSEKQFSLSSDDARGGKRAVVASQPLSQAESQIVEEVLDGLDLDDFDY